MGGGEILSFEVGILLLLQSFDMPSVVLLAIATVLRLVVQGEWNGYPYKVPLEEYRRLENMSARELNEHGKAMKQSIEEQIKREAKVRAIG